MALDRRRFLGHSPRQQTLLESNPLLARSIPQTAFPNIDPLKPTCRSNCLRRPTARATNRPGRRAGHSS